MTKNRIIWLRNEFKKKNGRYPNKTVFKSGEMVEASEWRKAKRYYLQTGKVLTLINN